MKNILTALLSSLLLIGCVTNVADLRADSERQATWEVAAPVRDVYRAYKEHFSATLPQAFLASGSPKFSGEYYGALAEFEVRYQGHPFAHHLYIWSEIRQSGGGSTVTVAWAPMFRRMAMELRDVGVAK